MSIARKYHLYHILFWLVLFATWHFFRYQDYNPKVGIWITAVKVADLALLVYITNYVLIPRLLYKKRYWLFGILFVAMVVASSIFKMYILGQLMNIRNIFSLAGGLKGRIYDNVLPHLLLVSTGAAFKLMLDQVRSQRKLAQLAKEKSDAELNFLKSQINPHFLFNSLNSVYFLIDKENSEARRTLLQFSDLLRYQLYDCNADRIAIEKEIGFLKDYIHLQELRRDSNYKVSVHVGEEVKGFSITPLLLIPFVENAFKHISNHSDQQNFVDVALHRQNGSLEFSVVNSKEKNARSTEPVGGIGLSNVKRRLELLYPGKHELAINGSEDTFSIKLKLKLSN
jgi:two-component system, LytTR family, sensor kinase